MGILRRLFKQRHHKRFIVQSGTFVIVSPGTDREQKVQLLDISQGGTAFIYQGSPEELEESGILKMLVERQYLANVPYDTASDIPAPGCECVQSSVPYRRRGVKFNWMGVLQEVELRNYIKKVRINP
ncbi:MAG: hypothetical protein NT140_12545 [Deltaproteobacteria bacterium]|nr:hypothetical protein [Deltaproteobacteria bacterium]